MAHDNLGDGLVAGRHAAFDQAGATGRRMRRRRRCSVRNQSDTIVRSMGAYSRCAGRLRSVRRSAQVALCAVAIIASGCGTVVHSARVGRSIIEAELRRSPPPLARLHADANRLIRGGPRAFAGLVRSVRGYPIVINEWASWCSNCVFEFPAFQRMAAKYGARVAFVGVNVEDNNGEASAFLRRFPVTYPRYFDPGQNIATATEAVEGSGPAKGDTTSETRPGHGAGHGALSELRRVRRSGADGQGSAVHRAPAPRRRRSQSPTFQLRS